MQFSVWVFIVWRKDEKICLISISGKLLETVSGIIRIVYSELCYARVWYYGHWLFREVILYDTTNIAILRNVRLRTGIRAYGYASIYSTVLDTTSSILAGTQVGLLHEYFFYILLTDIEISKFGWFYCWENTERILIQTL